MEFRDPARLPLEAYCRILHLAHWRQSSLPAPTPVTTVNAPIAPAPTILSPSNTTVVEQLNLRDTDDCVC